MSLWIDAAQHLATQDRNVRPRVEGPDWVGTVTRLADRFAPRMRTGTITQTGDEEHTHGRRRKVFGKRQSAQARAAYVAGLNQTVVTYQFKGWGRPYQYGFYNVEKYSFTDAPSTYVALPLYAFDLTSVNNNIGGTRYGHCPMLRAYRNFTNQIIEWHPCQSTNQVGTVVPTTLLTKSTPEVLPNSVNESQWQIIATQGQVSSAANDVYTTQYIDTIDIKLNLYAARQIPTRWTVDVCSFEQSLAPYCVNNTIPSMVSAPEDLAWHSQFWSGEMMTYVNHPVNTQRGNRSNPTLYGGRSLDLGSQYGKKGYKSWLRKPIIVEMQPKDTSMAEPTTATASRSHLETLTLNMRRTVNMMSRNKPMSNLLNQLGGADKPAGTTDPDVNATGLTTYDDAMTTCDQENRIFMIIKSTDYDDKVWSRTLLSPCRQLGTVSGAGFSDAWATKINDIAGEIGTMVDFNKSGSFDLNVIKRVIKTGL